MKAAMKIAMKFYWENLPTERVIAPVFSENQNCDL